MRLSQYGESRMDSKVCQLVNGKFTFEGSNKSPEQYILIFEESGPKGVYESFSFFIEPSAKVDIVIFPDSISKSIIKGSKLADEFARLEKILKTEFYSTLAKLGEEYNNAIKNGDLELPKTIISKGDSIQKAVYKWELDYIKSNPKSYISAYYLHSLYHVANPDTVRRYFNLLDTSLNESKYFRNIESFLSVAIGNSFSDFELSDGKGTLYKLSSIAKDKVILIDFWASWCIPCRKQNKKLASLYDTYKLKGFEIVGVSIDRDTTAFLNTIKEDMMTWINLIDRIDERAVHKTYSSITIPSNVLINNEGIIISKDINLGDLEHTIDSLLKK